jgi:NhaP-type Na+/H+ or K+/H+ antiporter
MEAVAMMKNIACMDFSVVWRRLAMSITCLRGAVKIYALLSAPEKAQSTGNQPGGLCVQGERLMKLVE